jgi:glycerol uptake facilitator-like aquaporin
MSHVLVQILCPTGFLVSAYFLTDQPYEATRFFQFWAVFILIAAIAQSLGLATGAAVEPQVNLIFEAHTSAYMKITVFWDVAFFDRYERRQDE